MFEFRRRLIGVALVVCVACHSAGPTRLGNEQVAAPAGQAEELLIVDCLLPPKVKKLGTSITYVAARQALKTSGVDCEIRGGEYVASDRGSYASALKVWLPLAQQGDPQAQNYVGEIYEKGLGIVPDYPVAAEWYGRAASQGYSPAQINLGQLYELGLGVPQDSRVAFDWYRRASGLDDLGVAFVSDGPASLDVAGLESELSASQAEALSLRAQLQNLQSEMDESRFARSEKLRDVEREGLGLTAAREALAAERTDLETRAAALDSARLSLDAERAAASASQSEIDARLAELAAAEAALAEQRLALQERAGEVARLASESELRRAEIARLDDQIIELGETLSIRRAEVAEASATVVALAGPSIQVIDPAIPETRALEVVVATRSVEERVVVGRVTAPAGLHTLTVNEQPTAVDSNGMFKIQVPVRASGSPVSIVAIDRKGKRADRKFRLEPDPDALPAVAMAPRRPPIEFGRYYAIVIGNNEYADLPDLVSAIPDARAVSKTLRDRYGFEVTLLENATRYEILSTLNEHRARLTGNDNLLLYYAGHGELDRVNNRGHWLPVDAEAENTANWISNVAITDVLNAMNAKHVLVVADSCYSGALARSALARLEAGMTDEARVSWQRAMAAKRSRTALTSGGLKPILDSGGGEHSIFATVFLEVLEANAEVLEGQRLFREVAARVTWAAEGTDFEQVPQYAPIKFAGHESGDFFFVPRPPDGLRTSSAPARLETASR